MGTFHRLDGNRRQTMGAVLGDWSSGGGRRLVQAVDLLDDQKNRKCDNQKIEDIVRFCHSLGIYNRRLYFIVDQFNALDYDEGINAAFSNDVPICKKETVYDLINKMTSEHYIIKSASANNKSALYLQRKQLQEDKMVLIGGYTEV